MSIVERSKDYRFSATQDIIMQLTRTKQTRSVSADLIEARESLELSREDAARMSGIDETYIEFFEGESPRNVTADIYARNRMRDYAKFLGLDAENSTNRFRMEREVRKAVPICSSELSMRQHPLKAVPSSRLLVTPKIIKAAALLMVAVGLGAYFFIAAQRLMAPPSVSILSPQDGLVTHERSLVVEGRTESEVSLLINGKPVNIDTDGNFSDRLDLHDGLNVIEVVAAKKHGKQTKVTRHIIVEPQERPTAILD